jgi:dihydroorotate dehydrogenase electron transfer subunit
MKPIPVEVLSNKQEAPGIYRLVLDPQIPLRELDPGSFFMVRVSEGIDPLLRRPLGVFRVGAGGIELLYQVRGRGTELLSRLKPGDTTDLVGPLGKGWKRMDASDHILLIAGGMGMSPLYDLAMNLRDFGDDRPITFVWGHRSSGTICCLSELKELNVNLIITTEDGSRGRIGQLTEHLDEIYAALKTSRVQAAACGPMPMLKKVAKFAETHRIPCQVSLETFMACGLGACLTCVAPGAGGNNFRVCKEGPVFWSPQIDWEAIP